MDIRLRLGFVFGEGVVGMDDRMKGRGKGEGERWKMLIARKWREGTIWFDVI